MPCEPERTALATTLPRVDRLPDEVAFRREFDTQLARRPPTDEFGKTQDTDLTGPTRVREEWVLAGSAGLVALTLTLFLIALLREDSLRWDWITGTSVGLLVAAVLGGVMAWSALLAGRAVEYDRRRARWLAAQPPGTVRDPVLPSPFLRPGHRPGRRPDTDIAGASMDTGRASWLQLAVLLVVGAAALPAAWHGFTHDDPSLGWGACVVLVVYVVPQVPVIIGGAVRARRYDRERAAWLVSQGLPPDLRS